MKYQEYQNILSNYIKNLASMIYADYHTFFGVEDDLFLYQLSTLDIPLVKFIDDKKKTSLVYSEFHSGIMFPTIVCNPMHPSLEGRTIEEKSKIFMEYLPYEIFSYIINSTKVAGSISADTQEFGSFLNLGLVSIMTREFANNHNMKIVNLYQANTVYAQELLNGMPQEIEKRKMIFQNNFLYMMELYQISTGKNLFQKYKSEILKENDIENMKHFVDKYLLNKKNLVDKIIENRTYGFAINELSTCLLSSNQNDLLSMGMEELSTLFPTYSMEHQRNMNLERKKANGFLVTSLIIASCILFGILLTILVH